MVVGEVIPDLDLDLEVAWVVMVEEKIIIVCGSCLSLNLFNRFVGAKSIPGYPGTCLIRSLANVFSNVKLSK